MKNQTNQKEQYPVPETNVILVHVDGILMQSQEDPGLQPGGGD